MTGTRARILSKALLLLAVVGIAVAGAVAAGVLGVPSVASVDNRFGEVTNETTTVVTNLTVRNPNPVGVTLGNTAVNYTVRMNDVRMATGGREGVAIERGNSTMRFTTEMRNERIPRWWYTHVDGGERTSVTIDATVTSSLLGGRSVSFGQQKQIQTDVIGQLDSTETRPVNANAQVVSDPVLYVNETRGAWNQQGLSPERTPIDVAFDVYNPKPYPYTVSEIGYTIRMNGIEVGNGSTEDPTVLAPKSTTTVETTTTIDNDRLDEWWVSHLRNDQVTQLEIDFYAVVDPEVGEEFRVDMESVDYTTTIETDVFGTKHAGGETATGNETRTTTTSAPSTETTTDGSRTTTASDGLLGGDDETSTPTSPPTETPTDSTADGTTATDDTTTTTDDSTGDGTTTTDSGLLP